MNRRETDSDKRLLDLLRPTPSIKLFEPNKREQLNSQSERLQSAELTH